MLNRGSVNRALQSSLSHNIMWRLVMVIGLSGSTIQGVIGRVISKSDERVVHSRFEVMSMITP